MAANLNRYTEKAQEAVLAAQQAAEARNHSQVDLPHLLLALLRQSDGVVPQVLLKLGMPVADLTNDVEAELKSLPQAYGPVQLHLSQPLSAALKAAEEEAGRMQDEYISTEHLFLGVLAHRQGPPG